jgi:hypothetical protein
VEELLRDRTGGGEDDGSKEGNGTRFGGVVAGGAKELLPVDALWSIALLIDLRECNFLRVPSTRACNEVKKTDA